ncbi:hypothetical protein [Pseudokineococcus sp. 1T1Z-3]|uniref:hypothetical protein n=1 Tax=Pseudokineococcus sp. 1T1Z-3 TaxID=3132745 RepID=UPI0030AA6D96
MVEGGAVDGEQGPTSVPAHLTSRRSYAAPSATCDVVMRGGVTSGVVYPWAVCELALRYRLVSVGGTSAGAVAAAAAAAAEHGRDGGATGRGGFPVLAQVPGRLAQERGGRSRLASLFEAPAGTAPLLALLLAVLRARRGGGWWRVVLTALSSALRAPGGGWRVLLGLVPGVLLVLAGSAGASGVAAVVVVVLGVVALVLGGLAGAAAVHLRALRVEVPRAFHGVVTGMPAPTAGPGGPGTRPDDPAQTLTPWLVEVIDEAAGLPDDEGPLTFGHLWAGPGRPAARGLASPPPDAAVDLRVVATSVVFGRPVSLPVDLAAPELPTSYLDPEELRRLLPERVVAALLDRPPPLPADPTARLVRQALDAAVAPLAPLPAASDLPVALAVRMSLSYPLLLSAVPLHALRGEAAALVRLRAAAQEVLATGGGRTDDDVAEVLRRVGPLPTRTLWFTDGGITSNFPVNLFDVAAPRRPTFGVTLRRRPTGAGPLDPGDPGPQDDARAPVVHPLAGPPGSTWRFLRAVLATAVDWADTVQLPLPTVRDRVAQVEVDPGDGGLDLRMPPEAVVRLAERGRVAGAALRERFSTTGADGWTGWERHRWTRLRATLPLLEGAAAEVTAALAPGSTGAGERDLRDLLRLPVDEAPLLPWASPGQRRRAQHAVAGLLAAAPEGVPAPERLGAGAPRPPLDLRYVPRSGG